MIVCVIGLGSFAAGCSGGRIYTPRELPSEFLAPRVSNAQTTDWSRFASYTISSEQVEVGDILEITIDTGYASGNQLNALRSFPARVAEDGTIYISNVGRIEVRGMELEAIEQRIAVESIQRDVYRDPSVTVAMKKQRMNRITVGGAVEEPGVYEIPRRYSYLLAAVHRAGGLNEEAAPLVKISQSVDEDQRPESRSRRDQTAERHDAIQTGFQAGSVKAIEVDLTASARQANGGYYLKDGAFVEVVRRDPRPISMIGLVRKPGQYGLPVNKELRLLDAIALANGVASSVADKVHIIRRVPGQDKPIRIEVSISEAKSDGASNILLAEGDTISVEQTPATIAIETIRSFIRFGVSSTIPLF